MPCSIMKHSCFNSRFFSSNQVNTELTLKTRVIGMQRATMARTSSLRNPGYKPYRTLWLWAIQRTNFTDYNQQQFEDSRLKLKVTTAISNRNLVNALREEASCSESE